MAFLHSLIHELCPGFESAVQLRICCKDLAMVLSPEAISVLALTKPVNNKIILDMCAAHTVSSQARLWTRLLAKSLVSTLENFAVYLCPYLRYFADEELILAQFRVTLAMLVRSDCCHLI